MLSRSVSWCSKPRGSSAGYRTQSSRRSTRVYAGTTSSNDFKNGLTIEIDGAPYKVVEFQHVKPGKGSAFVRSKIKNLLTGNTNEKTFRAGEKVDTADIVRSKRQYTYKDGEDFCFMDMETYDESRLQEDEWAKFLKEGMQVEICEWNGKVIDVALPNTVELLVVECDPGLKGDTSGGGSKPAKVETGATVTVPLFVQIDDVIQVDTRTGDYLGRA
ncbi:hypothetical protein PPROV_000580900 [Pycnococcus provasolii]|uniref:Elongation factor P n=1 Tax=Pycnococcus provasolii TaxID=41880 RepID=A0A830HIB0_9CHLO|nr:hypothetical protein PPROV_000580900 [Pycnococcus provasolii]|mmetsp:Transcript_8616/g.19599  ORF Transcript_8616/g.19599 Transcript_8616/m.19599 type:complete len:216 (-) Transcript_8616:99-746(-)